MNSRANRMQMRTSMHHRIVLRRVMVLTSSTIVLLFLGLILSINSASTNTVTASVASSKNRLVNH